MKGPGNPKQATLNGHPITLLGKLGEGRNIVYEAEVLEPQGKRFYAVKLQSEARDPAFGRDAILFNTNRFKGAVQTRGPYVFQPATGPKSNAVISEIVRGEPLDDYLEKMGPQGTDATVSIMAQVARTLHDAHRQGIVHLDIKPPNLIRENGTGIVRTIDWEMSARVTQKTSNDIGTHYYMAPEMALLPAKIHGGMDIYSLGLTAAEMNTGKRHRKFPRDWKSLAANDQHRMKRAHIAQENSHPTVSDPHMQLVINRATMRDTTHRASALDILVDLSAYRAARQWYDQDDRMKVIDHLVNRASNFATRNPVLDSPAAQGLLQELQRDHCDYGHLVAISKLGSSITKEADLTKSSKAHESTTGESTDSLPPQTTTLRFR